MHLASGYDLIQEEALMIALGTSEKKSEVYRSYPFEYFLILGFLAAN